MNFEFATAARIIFGAGKRSEVLPIARSFGERFLLVTGRNSSRAEWLRGEAVECFSIPGEPTVTEVERGVAIARECKADVVVAIGGGSAIDAGKAIAALATNEGNILEYLEIIGAGRALEREPLPFIAAPTTAGTGAEVTRNAVLASPEHQLKVSLRSPKMLPRATFVDPELTHELPPDVTASTGLDALTQLIEPFLCVRANPLTDALCREAIPRVARALPVVFKDGNNHRARAEMALGSLFGGLALANAGLGAVHGFAAPIGGMFAGPHGAICAALLPHALAVNYEALKKRNENGLSRFAELGALLKGNPIEMVKNLCDELEVPPLRAYGLRAEHVETLCERAAQSSSMKANPIQLTRAELREILERAT